MLTDCNTFWVKNLLSLRINLEYEITVCTPDLQQMRSLYTSVIRYNCTKTRIREFYFYKKHENNGSGIYTPFP